MQLSTILLAASETASANFLTPILVMAVIGLCLSLLLVIAEYFLANYGECKININDEEERSFVTEGGNSLLNILSDRKIFIPSACGGRATCGFCKLKLPEAGAALPTELPMLSREEVKNGTRLICQVKVTSDLNLHIPQELLEIQEFKCVVGSNEDSTHNIKELVLELKDPDHIGFIPGQYIQFQMPPHIAKGEQRAYSIASTRNEDDGKKVILNIRWGFGGLVSTYVSTLKPGDEVIITGPYGDFMEAETGAEMICVAGGAGMAPLRSIILDLAKKNSKRKVTYFFGGRDQEDLFYLDTWAELEKSMHDFSFVPALSDIKDDDTSWTGERGFVHLAVERYINERCESDPEQLEGYLCGPPPMIDGVIAVMTAIGVPEEKIYFDKF